MTDTIGVLGCGWLGTPLAKSLLEKGYQVRGSTTATQKLEQLQSFGIEAQTITLEEERIVGDIDAFLKDLDILIVNIPPQLRRKPHQNFVKRVARLKQHLEKSRLVRVIFVSSTSVYGNVEGDITEDTLPKPATEAGKQLLEAESLLANSTQLQTTIVRFGGLIGPERHPVTFLSGKENLGNGDEHINLIHLNDCIALITTILEEGLWGELFNGVYPYHPSKREYYTQEAQKRKLQAPHYSDETSKTYKKNIKSKLNLTNYNIFLTPITS